MLLLLQTSKLRPLLEVTQLLRRGATCRMPKSDTWTEGAVPYPSCGISALHVPQDLPKGSLAPTYPSPHPGASESRGLGWGPRLCILDKRLGETDAADLGGTENHSWISSLAIFALGDPPSPQQRKE